MSDLSDLKDEAGDEYPYVELVHQAPHLDGYHFNPVALIRVVNGLLPLGKKHVLNVLRVYFRISTTNPARREQYDLDEDRIFSVARLLFVCDDPEHGMPPLLVGIPELLVSKEYISSSLFPLILIHQIPFLLVGGYMLGGLPQSPLDHVEYYQNHCRLRSKPLLPETTPLIAVEDLLAQEAISSESSEGRAAILYRQALRALTPLSDQQTQDLSVAWPQYLREIRKQSFRWSSEEQAFVPI